MDKQTKEKLVETLHTRLEKAMGTFLVDYKGLNVEAINQLRGDLRKADAEFQVVKNRLLKLACRETDTAQMLDHMEGPTAIALTYEEVVQPAKVLVEFSKGNQHLEIKSGQIDGRLLDAKDIKRLAELPKKDVLLAQTLSAMQAVPGSFVRVLNGMLTQLLYVLTAIQQEKEASA